MFLYNIYFYSYIEPYLNPSNVSVFGDTSSSMIISWNPIPVLERNGPGFGYIVRLGLL